MKVSNYIQILQELQSEHGNLEVETYSVCGDKQEARTPEIRFCLILTRRQSKPRFWYSGDAENVKGEKVIYV